MSKTIISAVFDSRSEAESAVGELRGHGIDSARLSVIGRDEAGGSAHVTDGEGVHAGESIGDTVKGALGGAGIGAILGVAALAIRASVRSPRPALLRAPRFLAPPRSARVLEQLQAE